MITYKAMHSQELREELAYLKSPNWKPLPSRSMDRWEEPGKWKEAGPYMPHFERMARIKQWRASIAEAVD